MSISTPKNAISLLSNAIVLSGSARSGTTITGKILHSFHNVEYLYEPPIIFTLLALRNKIGEDEFKAIYGSYLYDEFLVNSIAGRAINCNIHDDSSIYNVKSKEEVSSRLRKKNTKIGNESIESTYQIAYKANSIIPFIPFIQKIYPSTKVIITLRGPIGVINSILRKEWFSKKNNAMNFSIPFRQKKGVNIPFWVKKHHDDVWIELSEIDRAAYYYIQAYDGIENFSQYNFIRYTELISNPINIVENLADSLNLDFGAKTKSIISTIKPTDFDRDIAIISKISQEFRNRLKDLMDFTENDQTNITSY